MTIEILDTVGGQEDFELSEVLLYELTKEDDLMFLKLYDCDFWENDKDMVTGKDKIKTISDMFVHAGKSKYDTKYDLRL